MAKKVISREPKEKRADNILKVKVKKAPTKLELELQVKNYDTVAVLRNGKHHLIITTQKIKIQICALNLQQF